MRLTNLMEQIVRTHLNQLRADSAGGDETCWCPLCRADMMALALSALPPRYATSHPQALDGAPRTEALIVEKVAQARTQVQRNPKHPRGAAVAAGEPVWIVNFPLEESFRAVDGIIRRHEGSCDCWHCRCDMVAFALNRYPARYGVEHRGATHLHDSDRSLMREELGSFLDLAARVVSAVPRHEVPTAAA